MGEGDPFLDRTVLDLKAKVRPQYSFLRVKPLFAENSDEAKRLRELARCLLTDGSRTLFL